MDFQAMLAELLSKKNTVIINIADKRDESDRLTSLIERLIKVISGQNKATPMG